MSTARPGKGSLLESIAWLPVKERREVLKGFSEQDCEELLFDWRAVARPEQILPGTPRAAIQRKDWRYWLAQAGRGWGKTRVGAETVREWGENPTERILMIAPTSSDVREVMIEGPSGLLSCYPSHRKPHYNSSRHLVEFPSGAIGMTRSAEEPERLRGPQFTKFWADELCAWNFAQDAWDQIMFGFRLPTPNLQGIITTTPKPIDVLKKLIKNPRTVVTRGSSYENAANLSDSFIEDVIKPYEGTRLGRQEINAELLEDIPGALWTRKMIDATRVAFLEIRWDMLIRVVVAIDPAVTAHDESDETGIVVAALTRSHHVIVLDDLSCRESPLGWAKVTIAAYRSRQADRIIGEVNNGGDLVGANIHAVAPEVAFRAVRASRGKAVRAEPVAALYEQGRVHHVSDPARPNQFLQLEDQMCSFVPGVSSKSPDRMDALVWAVTELLIDHEQVQGTLTRPIHQISPI